MEHSTHIVPALCSDPGFTVIEHAGMNVEDFTVEDAYAVDVLLDTHGMADLYVVEKVLRGDQYVIVRNGVSSPIDDVEEIPEDLLLLVLNDDDETTLRTPDDLVPGEFLAALVELLGRVANRCYGGTALNEFLLSVTRKGRQVTSETGAKWEDYATLLYHH